MILTFDSLLTRAIQMGFDVDRIEMSDRNYFLPSLEWLTGPFSKALAETFSGRLPVEDANDCDDYALIAAAQARRGNMDRPGAREGIGFGIARVLLEDGPLNGIRGPGFHSTNLVFCSDSRVYLYEPQNRKWIEWEQANPGPAFCDRLWL